jgi:3-dehydroquinate dehydratase-1
MAWASDPSVHLTWLLALAHPVRSQVEAPPEWKKEMVALAKKHNVKVIISHHNYDSTPSAERLEEIVTECFADGADIGKIAVASHSEKDTARVLALHDDDRPVVMLAMGEKGKISRVAGPLLGAPFTFVAATPETATAPGQLTAAQMRGLYAAM